MEGRFVAVINGTSLPSVTPASGKTYIAYGYAENTSSATGADTH